MNWSQVTDPNAYDAPCLTDRLDVPYSKLVAVLGEWEDDDEN